MHQCLQDSQSACQQVNKQLIEQKYKSCNYIVHITQHLYNSLGLQQHNSRPTKQKDYAPKAKGAESRSRVLAAAAAAETAAGTATTHLFGSSPVCMSANFSA